MILLKQFQLAELWEQLQLVLDLLRVVIRVVKLPYFATSFISFHKGHVPIEENCLNMVLLNVDIFIFIKFFQILLDISECLYAIF